MRRRLTECCGDIGRLRRTCFLGLSVPAFGEGMRLAGSCSALRRASLFTGSWTGLVKDGRDNLQTLSRSFQPAGNVAQLHNSIRPVRLCAPSALWPLSRVLSKGDVSSTCPQNDARAQQRSDTTASSATSNANKVSPRRSDAAQPGEDFTCESRKGMVDTIVFLLWEMTLHVIWQMFLHFPVHNSAQHNVVVCRGKSLLTTI